jgi:hypothetical protein
MRKMTKAEARSAVNAIRSNYDALVEQATELYERRGWEALGYDTYEAMCKAEFGERKLPPLIRKDTVIKLRSRGLSTRGIAAATGASKGTVDNDLSGAQDWAPDATIIGIDGKTYQAKQTKARTKLKRRSPEDPPLSTNDLLNLLARTIESLCLIQVYIEDLGPAVYNDANVRNHMQTLHDEMTRTFSPYINNRRTS